MARKWLAPLLVSSILFIFFLCFAAWGIYTGDSGDLVTAGYLFGVPHPPGYPLYTFAVWLASQLPVATVAFRAALLSSLFHAATAGMLYAFVKKMTGRWFAALFAVLLLASNYVFFLYSVTPEVFALFDFFVIALTYILWEWSVRPRPATLYVFSFAAGLSLSHHHLILFLFPGFFFILWNMRTKIKGSVLPYILWFLAGLVPYLYVPIAAHTDAIINWNRATDLENFVRLITRADYGTFRSGAVFGEGLAHRWVQVLTYFRFILLDFGWAGSILAVLGGFGLWRRSRLFASALLLNLFIVGPSYFFYASFPLVNRFMLGTYERFLLPSYMLLALLAAVGVAEIAAMKHRLLRNGLILLAFLTPVIFLIITVFRFWGLPQDRTAEKLASDVLHSVPQEQSMLLLSRDTTLFATQYQRYVNEVRSDLPVLAFNHLGDVRYRQLVTENFPAVAMPPAAEGFWEAFIKENAQMRRIFTNTEIPLPPGWILVPHGLVYEVMEEENKPGAAALYEVNEALWATYHNPAEGILERYNHLMLADVRDVYAQARIALGKAYISYDEVAWAREEFARAVALEGDILQADAYTYLGLSELWLGNCEAALEAFGRAREAEYVPPPALTLYESVTYKDCVGDEGHAQDLFERYTGERAREEIPLETL